MKKVLLGLIFTFFLSLAFGQISFSPDPVEVFADPNETENIQADFEIKNEGEGEYQLAWKLEVVSQPTEWQYYVCDTEICYNFNQNTSSTEKPNILKGNSTIVVMFHTIPAEVEGQGEYIIRFFDVDDPDEVLIEVPIIVNTITTSTIDKISKGLAIFPNPASDHFKVNTGDVVKKIEVCSVVGKRISIFRAEQGKHYDVSGLIPGMYYVRLLDEKDGIIKVMKLKKI